MNYIKVLGSSGSKTKNSGATSFQISKKIVVDAGNLLNTIEQNSFEIEHIFLTHAHLDHICDIPFIIDNYFEKIKKPIIVYGSKITIESVKNNIFNNTIWPDFSRINILNTNTPILEFRVILENEKINIGKFSINAIKANHTEGSLGYLVSKNNIKYIISGDTFLNDDLISYLNENIDISTLVIECSFPNRLQKLANDSKHLTPNTLNLMLSKLKRKDIKIFIYHLKYQYKEEISLQIADLDILKNGGKILEDGDIIDLESFKVSSSIQESDMFDRVIDINLKLSSQQDRHKLYEMILTLTRELTKSDAGTLYLLSEDKKHLDFQLVQNDTLDIYLGTKEQKIAWDSLPLYLEDGSENRTMVAVVSAMDNKIINITDVYSSNEYNFEGTKSFDESKHYHSKSMLVTPLINHENDVIGVLQLINKDIKNKNSYYTKYDEKILKALSSQAAMALTNTKLIDSLELFLESFVTSIANAIDAKSRHTSTHIGKMSKLAPMIANAINSDKEIYNHVDYDENNLKQIELAAKLHDIGKISIPEWVIDKSTKLQSLIDKVEIIRHRFEILKRDLKIDFLEEIISKDEYETKILNLEESLKFIEKSNVGSEFMSDADILKIQSFKDEKYILNNVEQSLLNSDEIYNLSIRKGTLTSEEKDIMNSHAQLSFDMLNALPFPKKYSDIMHIASNHHEKLNGKGYPRGLIANEIVLEDRILILADVFEALTSNDRPYKGIKKLSEVFKILGFMAKDGEIDADLLEFFKKSDAFKEYCNTELLKEQLDV